MVPGILLAVSLLMSPAARSPWAFSGIWILNSQESDFGVMTVPQQFVMRVQPADRSLAVVEITTEHNDRTVTYRQIPFDEKGDSWSRAARLVRIGWSVESTADLNSEETWRLSDLGDLVIQRLVRNGNHTVLQRLVLERSTQAID